MRDASVDAAPGESTQDDADQGTGVDESPAVVSDAAVGVADAAVEDPATEPDASSGNMGCALDQDCPGRVCRAHVCACPEGATACADTCLGPNQCCGSADCPEGATCKSGSCECPSGSHRCGERCAADTSPASCGQSCQPCEKPTGGDSVCEQGSCKPTCPTGQRPCLGECIPNGQACSGTCPTGSHDCSGVCVPNTSVNGCGSSSCSPCSAPQNSSASCDGNSCHFTCASTHKLCGSECILQAACCGANDCSSTATCAASHQCDCAAGKKRCGSGAALQCFDGNCCNNADCQSSAQCSAAHTCACAAGQKTCGTGTAVTCVASTGCCSDADCSTGWKCGSGVCRSWCAQQTRPSGVLAADYQCMDFESGLPAAATWARATSNGGTVTTVATPISSPPQAMRSEVVSGSAQLVWDIPPGLDISAISISAQVRHPGLEEAVMPPGSDFDLLCVVFDFGSNGTRTQCLSWTNGALRASDGTERSYRGYYLRYRFDSWAGSLGGDCALTSVPSSRWNSITMSLGSGVTAPITINGSSAGSCSPPFVTAGTAKVRLGLSSTLPILWQVYYDNVVVSVRR
jgi:hypothetical protein